VGPLDVLAEIQAVLPIKSPLVATTGVLVQYVSETDAA
jgi:hypothetical protein